MFAFIIGPVFIFMVYNGVESWTWRAVLAAFVFLAYQLWGPGWMAAAAIIIIGIFLKNSLPKVSKF